MDTLFKKNEKALFENISLIIYGLRHEISCEFFANIGEGDVDGIIRNVRKMVSAPNIRYESFPRYCLLLIGEKCFNDETFIFRKIYRFTSDLRFLRSGVESDIFVPYDRFIHESSRTSENCLDSCDKFIGDKWLRKIIVGTEIESVYNILTIAIS